MLKTKLSPKWRLKKQTWDNSLYLFAKECLGYTRLRVQPHRQMCLDFEEFILDKELRTMLYLAPRISFKTTVGGQALPLWIERKFPGCRLLITSSTHRNSVKRLNAIKNICEGVTLGGRRFMKAYGDWRTMPGWTGDYVDFPSLAQRKEGTVHEHSIDTAGIDRTQVGDHYDIIIVDDIHDENNCDTAEQIERVIDYLQTLSPYLDRKSPLGKILFLGTRWNFGDAYEWLEQNEPSIKVVQHSCWDGPDGLYFPEELDHEFLAAERARLKARRFSCWYENKPMADEDKVFKEEWKQVISASYATTKMGGEIVFNDDEDLPTRIPVIARLTLDPALGTSKKSDYIGCTLMGWAADGARYIIKTWRWRETPKQVIDKLISIIQQYNVKSLGIEAVGFQRIYHDMVQEKFIEKGVLISIHKIDTENWRSKRKRIEALLEPQFSSLKVFILPGNELFISDYDKWPQLKYDDLFDSTAMQFETPFMEPPKEIEVSRTDYWHTHPSERNKLRERRYAGFPEIRRKKYTGVY